MSDVHGRPFVPRPLCAALVAASAVLSLAPHAFGQTKPLGDRVNQAFGLERSNVIAIDLNATRGGGLLTFVSIEGQPAFLNLEPTSVRGSTYQILVQQPDGSLAPAAPGPETTYRGEAIGLPGSVVSASLLEDGLHASIRLPDGSSYWLEPIGTRIAGAGLDQHVLYHNDDVLEFGGQCGANDMLRVRQAQGGPAAGGDEGGMAISKAAAAFCTAELACDADFEYFQTWGSVSAVESRINAVINAVNFQYERDVAITHVITTIIVRTAEPDPYTSTDAATLLNQFRNHWQANHGGIQRDLAQLFTGKEINSGTIGIAWIGAVCTDFGYSMVQSDFNGTNSFACTTDLSAHELGHNWGADHCGCQRPQPYTMNAFITCANQFHPMRTIPEIIAFRDSRPCLDSCGSGPPPPPPGCTSASAVASHTCTPGGKGNTCLTINIAITCDGSPLSGATVAVRLDGSSGDVLTGSATTDSNGQVSFKLRCNQAASASYTSTVTAINGASTNVSDPNVQIAGCDI